MKIYNPYNVKVGQIWQDWDIRFRCQNPVYKKIIKIENGFAYCEGIQNHRVISHSKIKLERFKPNATGYFLVSNN